MNITADEKQMYQVMKAIFDSGIPICFKGSMVLKACLHQAGFSDEVRRTVDIDANWISERPFNPPNPAFFRFRLTTDTLAFG